MKKIIVFILLVFTAGAALYLWRTHPFPATFESNSENKSELKNTHNTNPTSTLFVPYWTVDSELGNEEYDTFAYFGITVDENGIQENEPGINAIDEFVIESHGKRTGLVLRMLNTNISNKIMRNKTLTQRVLQETAQIAKENDFSEVIIDLEFSAIPFDSVIQNVTNFYTAAREEMHKNDLDLGILIYGDVFVRARPYDMEKVGELADTVYVMTYDYHKARGNPGPNFPLMGRDVYGYDLELMADDFLKTVPVEKISVIFGMFGYDWTVNNEQESSGIATSIATSGIENKFVSSCPYENCKIIRDDKSKENEIRYRDESGKNHVVWYEDELSRRAKEDYLKTRGITSFGAWAYSYY